MSMDGNYGGVGAGAIDNSLLGILEKVVLIPVAIAGGAVDAAAKVGKGGLKVGENAAETAGHIYDFATYGLVTNFTKEVGPGCATYAFMQGGEQVLVRIKAGDSVEIMRGHEKPYETVVAGAYKRVVDINNNPSASGDEKFAVELAESRAIKAQAAGKHVNEQVTSATAQLPAHPVNATVTQAVIPVPGQLGGYPVRNDTSSTPAVHPPLPATAAKNNYAVIPVPNQPCGFEVDFENKGPLSEGFSLGTHSYMLRRNERGIETLHEVDVNGNNLHKMASGHGVIARTQKAFEDAGGNAEKFERGMQQHRHAQNQHHSSHNVVAGGPRHVPAWH